MATRATWHAALRTTSATAAPWRSGICGSVTHIAVRTRAVRVASARWQHNNSDAAPKTKEEKEEDAAAEEAMKSAGAVSASIATGGYPASFVLPTSVPSISKLAEAEASHRRKLLGILTGLDLPPFKYAFAYGSGVFKQRSSSEGERKPMVDVIVAVNNARTWHERNMMLHPKHYPWYARMLGAWGIGKVQKMGAKLWFTPFIESEGNTIKYGVIEMDAMAQDLLDWSTLYVSGRMHKPTATLFDASEGRIPLAQQANLTSALRTSFLLLPERFTERELYMTMTSLSYMGDFRMSVPGGENRNKIANIVESQSSWFRIMCADLITRLAVVRVQWAPQERWMSMHQDDSPHARAALASKLPVNLRQRVIAHFLKRADLHVVFAELRDAGGKVEKLAGASRMPPVLPKLAQADADALHDTKSDASDIMPPLVTRFWLAAVQEPSFQQVLRDQVAAIVSEPARVQSLKGLYTAGLFRSLRYVFAKIGKYREGQRS